MNIFYILSPFQLYVTQHRIETIVKEVYVYVKSADQTFRNDSAQYIDAKSSLTDLAKHIIFPEMLAYVQPRIATGKF